MWLPMISEANLFVSRLVIRFLGLLMRKWTILLILMTWRWLLLIACRASCTYNIFVYKKKSLSCIDIAFYWYSSSCFPPVNVATYTILQGPPTSCIWFFLQSRGTWPWNKWGWCKKHQWYWSQCTSHFQVIIHCSAYI